MWVDVARRGSMSRRKSRRLSDVKTLTNGAPRNSVAVPPFPRVRAHGCILVGVHSAFTRCKARARVVSVSANKGPLMLERRCLSHLIVRAAIYRRTFIWFARWKWLATGSSTNWNGYSYSPRFTFPSFHPRIFGWSADVCDSSRALPFANERKGMSRSGIEWKHVIFVAQTVDSYFISATE